MDRLAELEIVVPPHDAEQLARAPLHRVAAEDGPRRPGGRGADEVDRPQALMDQVLFLRELEDAAGRELRRHLQRMVIAVRVHEQLVGIDLARNLLSGQPADAGDVARGCGVV